MIPKDPFMLLSYINTQLRDHYSSLEDLCASLDINKEEIMNILNQAGYLYSEAGNKFIPK